MQAEIGTVRTTGIVGLDTIIVATLAGDAATLTNSIRFTPTACIATPQGIGAPPLCRSGEPDGTLVDVLPSAACEGFFSRPDELRLGDALPGNANLYAVYRATTDAFPPGKYVAVFGRPNTSDRRAAFALVTDDAKIVGIHYGCDGTPESFAMFQRLTDAILPPQ